MAREHRAEPGPSSGPPDPGPSTGPPPAGTPTSTTTRRAALIVPIVAVVVGLVVVLATLPGASVPTTSPSPSTVATSAPSPVAQDAGYLIDIDGLRERARLAADGLEPYRSAVDDLLEWAASAKGEVAQPVQPIRIVGTDGPFVEDARRAYGMGLAYVVTGDETYATAARTAIRAWVDTATSTVDTCPDGGGCNTSLIIGRAGAGFAMGAALLEGSSVWTTQDRDDLRTWMHDVLLPAASRRPNNWGDAGTFLRVVAADYAGDDEEFTAALDQWRAGIDLIEADGRIPEEVRRGDAGISYTQEALQYKVAVAEIAARRGIDLWSYRGSGGGTLRGALDRLADYWFRPDDWPDDPDPTVPSPGPQWEIAYAHYRDPRWEPIIEARRPYGDRGHSAVRWTTLTNGLPFEPVVAGGSSPSPSPTPAPTTTASPSETPSPTPGEVVAGLDRLSARLRDPFGVASDVRIAWTTVPADASVEIQRSVDGGPWRDRSPGSAVRLDDEVPLDTAVDYRIRPDGAVDAVLWSTIDDLRVRRQEASARTVDLEGSWSHAEASGYSAGSALSTDSAGAAVVWRGTARSLVIVGPVGPTRGRLVVEVDGERVDVVDLYAPDFAARTVLVALHWNDGAEHVVRLEARHRSGRTTVAIDDLVTLTAAITVVRDSSP